MGQSRANRSLRPHSLLNRERTGNFGELPVNRWHVSSNPRLFSIGYESNSLTIGTGNLTLPPEPLRAQRPGHVDLSIPTAIDQSPMVLAAREFGLSRALGSKLNQVIDAGKDP
jgi:hypothetical protein